jgi:hypothetical protein
MPFPQDRGSSRAARAGWQIALVLGLLAAAIAGGIGALAWWPSAAVPPPAPIARQITITGGWATPGKTTNSGSLVMFTAHNSGPEPVVLWYFRSTDAFTVSPWKAGATEPVILTVPAQSALELDLFGPHVRLGQLRRDLDPGDTAHLTIHFRDRSSLDTTLPIRQLPPPVRFVGGHAYDMCIVGKNGSLTCPQVFT